MEMVRCMEPASQMDVDEIVVGGDSHGSTITTGKIVQNSSKIVGVPARSFMTL